MVKLSTAEEAAISKLLSRTQELIQLGKLDEAEKFLEEILKFKPDEPNAFFQRGAILMNRGDNEGAIAQFTKVHEKVPDFVENLNHLGTACQALKRYDEAISYYLKSLAINSDSAIVNSAIATCHFRQGELDKAIEFFRRSLSVSPEAEYTHSNILLVMIYSENISPEDLANEARLFGKKISENFIPKTQFANDFSKNRKIRVGYVSPDFREHPVPYFLEPLFQNHDREKFEIYAYSKTMFDNKVMERMKPQVDFWRDIRHMKTQEVCNLIAEDKIDILVDLCGHSAYNSLHVFACKPAPIQASWLGFTATTGVEAIDYRITDVHADPSGMTEYLNTETLWRLPHIFGCYKPHKNSPSVIDHPPFEDNGYVTFGCFNNFVKVRDCVLQSWGKILGLVPSARMLLEIDEIDDPAYRHKIQRRLENNGISLDRVNIEPRKKENQFVLYNKIDIALDPFPCVGGTTSMDTLWMGVPFVTLAGRHFGSRMGVSILKNVGLGELIAQNIEEYIAIAAGLAKDKERLRNIRYNLRQRFAASPAMDQKSFTCDLEEAYRGMWAKYCDSKLRGAA